MSNMMSDLTHSTPGANKQEQAIVGSNKANRRLAREVDTLPSSSSNGPSNDPPPKRHRPAVVHEVKLPDIVHITKVLEKYIALLVSIGRSDN